jgi:hypothetical protein
MVEVGETAIDRYLKDGSFAPSLKAEDRALLTEAGSDLRIDLGALGEGKFKRIIRISKAALTRRLSDGAGSRLGSTSRGAYPSGLQKTSVTAAQQSDEKRALGRLSREGPELLG